MTIDLDQQLIDAARFNQMEKVIDLIERGANPTVDDSLPLFWASKNGNSDLVKYLIPVSDVSAYHNEALRIAHRNNHQKVCLLLLPHCNPTDQESIVTPLHVACELHCSQVVCDYLDKYHIDVAAQITQMQTKNYSAESIAVLESVLQSRVLRKNIGEEISLSNIGLKRKL